jgi:hypothetical protein
MKKIKITKVDDLFSKWIRERDNWTCQRCKTKYTPPTNALQCSHFWSRHNKCTRFDPLNCDALCYGCHALWEGNKQGDYRDWKIRQLGKKGYEALEKRARGICSERVKCEETLAWLKQ